MVSRKIAVFAIGSIGSAVLGLITLPIITWFYSAEDVGRIAMLQVASNFCVLLFCLGLIKPMCVNITKKKIARHY